MTTLGRIPSHYRPDGAWCRFSLCDSRTGQCPECDVPPEKTP